MKGPNSVGDIFQVSHLQEHRIMVVMPLLVLGFAVCGKCPPFREGTSRFNCCAVQMISKLGQQIMNTTFAT